jgi:hypothetical protein
MEKELSVLLMGILIKEITKMVSLLVMGSTIG